MEGGTSSTGLRIESFDPGPYATNCYVVIVPGACWIVDAGFEPGAMIERVKELGLVPAALILTHAHVDHIAGVGEVRRSFPAVPIWIHEGERDWLGDPELNLSVFSGAPVSAPGPDRVLRDGERLTLGGGVWEVLHTPGHSPGGICLHNREEGIALVGDALFAGSIGRTDFPGSSHAQLLGSIREKLYTLPGGTIVLPGHGEPTTIDRERRTNPFVRA